VAGADRFRNPDEDVPADFAARRDEHYAALDLPRDPEAFIAGLQGEMRAALDRFDRGLPRNADVRITSRGSGWIRLTPLQPKPPPANIEALKAAIAAEWPMTDLLDVVKEADLRLGFTDRLRSPTAYEALERAVLRPRLLLCLNGMGTNAGLKRMASVQHRGEVRFRPKVVLGLPIGRSRKRSSLMASNNGCVPVAVLPLGSARHPSPDGVRLCRVGNAPGRVGRQCGAHARLDPFGGFRV
jgi:hypothetical protein